MFVELRELLRNAEQFVGIIGVKIVEVKKKEQEKSYAN